MRGSVVLLCLLAAQVGAEPEERRRPARWQQSMSAPALSRVWGVGTELYGVGATGAHRSTDGGATWTQVGDPGAAIGVWGSGLDDVWVVRARSVHHSIDGAGEYWTRQTLAVSSTTQLEGMWGSGRELYVFGSDQSLRSGVVLHTRDGGATWQREAIDLELVSGMWGSGPDNVYAVGARGAVMRSTGVGDWKMVRPPSGNTLEGIWGASATAIYAVGSDGMILFSSNGTTWTPRTSGVRYALSSIVGLSAKELYIGSKDGPPLRSADGVTWKPITALVPRGDVWAHGDRVVAAAGEVHFVGERPAAAVVALPPTTITPLPTVSPLPPLNYRVSETMTKREALALRLLIEGEKTHPHLRDLIRIATWRFGDRLPALPRLSSPGAPPRMRIRSVTGCGSFTPPTTSAYGDELVGTVRCQMTCKVVTVKMTALIPHNGAVAASVTSGAKVDIASCKDQRNGVADGVKAVTENLVQRQYLPHLDISLQKDLGKAATMSARADALAHYVLAGGQSVVAKNQLAAALGVSPQWPGLFWNPMPGAHPLDRNVCGRTSLIEKDGDESVRQNRHAEALGTFEAIASCDPKFVEKAYLSACGAEDRAKATIYYQRLPGAKQTVLLAACTKLGIDPRTP